MATFHAASEQYELGELDGRLVAFTNMRLDRESIPDGLHCYDIRDSDHLDGSCAEVKKYVMVNHWGTILSKAPFPVDEHGSYYPDNLRSKPTMWLWQLRDIGIVGVGLVVSVLAFTQTGFPVPMVLTAAYAFLSIRFEDTSILNFIRYAGAYFVGRQEYEWHFTREVENP